jgi:hypothetical protein
MAPVGLILVSCLSSPLSYPVFGVFLEHVPLRRFATKRCLFMFKLLQSLIANFLELLLLIKHYLIAIGRLLRCLVVGFLGCLSSTHKFPYLLPIVSNAIALSCFLELFANALEIATGLA